MKVYHKFIICLYVYMFCENNYTYATYKTFILIYMNTSLEWDYFSFLENNTFFHFYAFQEPPKRA